MIPYLYRLFAGPFRRAQDRLLCLLGVHGPGGWHQWAGPDDVEHAASTGQADPSGQKCGCVCADGPVLDHEPEAEREPLPLDLDPCPVCGSEDACGYDLEGRPLIHALGAEWER